MRKSDSCVPQIRIYHHLINSHQYWWSAIVSHLQTSRRVTPYTNRDQHLHSIAVNTLRPRRNGRHFADDIFRSIFLNENIWIPIKISLESVPKGPVNNIPALVQIMAWRRPGDKPLSEPMMIILLMHICVSRPQWVKVNNKEAVYFLAQWFTDTECSVKERNC